MPYLIFISLLIAIVSFLYFLQKLVLQLGYDTALPSAEKDFFSLSKGDKIKIESLKLQNEELRAKFNQQLAKIEKEIDDCETLISQYVKSSEESEMQLSAAKIQLSNLTTVRRQVRSQRTGEIAAIYQTLNRIKARPEENESKYIDAVNKAVGTLVNRYALSSAVILAAIMFFTLLMMPSVLVGFGQVISMALGFDTINSGVSLGTFILLSFFLIAGYIISRKVLKQLPHVIIKRKSPDTFLMLEYILNKPV